MKKSRKNTDFQSFRPALIPTVGSVWVQYVLDLITYEKAEMHKIKQSDCPVV